MSKISIESHVEDVCKMGHGEKCCSYLGMGADGWVCLKESSLKANIDARVKANTMTAKGDNCVGFDALKKSK